MTYRSSLTLIAMAALLAGACGEEKLPATEQIRSTLMVAATPADTAAPDSTAPAAVAATTLSLPDGDTLAVREEVARFYRDRGFAPLWTDAEGLLPEGERMVAALGAAVDDGLDPERYNHSTALDLARVLAEDGLGERAGELEYLATLDLMLTESYVRLARDLAIGTIDPRSADLEWRIERGEAPADELLARLNDGQEPATVLASLRPSNHHYDLLRDALARFRAIEEAGGWPTIPEGETLKPGDRDPRVAALRNRLMAGDDAEEKRLASLGLGDPILFDDDLVAAVERFQKRHELFEDGALGPNTLEAMNIPVEQRTETLRLNLDRWRWLPNDLGDRYVMVNIAGFEMEFVVDGKAVESMNVVVGRTANRTPIFQDTLQYIVVNPYWNVPVSIASEEILPAAMRDPGYLARNNYEVLYNGNVVRAAALSPSYLSRGYSIRQRPGPGNALGDVKFLFPNDMNIYLHDTPANHLFSQKTRAFSHGCIRLERPADLARAMFQHLTDRDPADYDRLRAATGEQWVTLDQKIPVYILYFTAWVDDDGTTRFHSDVYDRDRGLEEEADRQAAPARSRSIAQRQT